MKFIDLKTQLADFILFSLSDIKNFDPNFHRRQLNEWQNKGYIKKIRREYYIFSDLNIDDGCLFYIANKLYPSSYLSLEMGLSNFHLIPESVYTITSVSTSKTATFTTPLGTFVYQHLRPQLMFGTKLVPYKNKQILIGEIEKIILDYFYLHTELNSKNKILSLRLNQEILTHQVDWSKLDAYLAIYHNQQLTKRIKMLKESLSHA